MGVILVICKEMYFGSNSILKASLWGKSFCVGISSDGATLKLGGSSKPL